MMRGIAAILVVLGALMLEAAPASADCLSLCMKTQGCSGASAASQSTMSGSCANMNSFCQLQCQPSGNGMRYGAIAYSPKSNAWGTVRGLSDQSSAEAAAMAYCGKYAADCQLLLSYADACVAVSISRNNIIAWDFDPKSRGLAENKARDDCQKKSGGSCRGMASDCSLP